MRFKWQAEYQPCGCFVEEARKKQLPIYCDEHGDKRSAVQRISILTVSERDYNLIKESTKNPRKPNQKLVELAELYYKTVEDND